MKHLKLYLLACCLAAPLLEACTSSETSGAVMRGDGAFRAHIRQVDSQVNHIENELDNMSRYELDSTEHSHLSTEYPYWKRVHIYLDEDGIRKTTMYGDYEKGNRTEEMYFKEGKLIYGTINKEGLTSTDRGDAFYFAAEKLIFAVRASGEQLDVKEDTVKIRGIDLLQEARQLGDIMASKKIKP